MGRRHRRYLGISWRPPGRPRELGPTAGARTGVAFSPSSPGPSVRAPGLLGFLSPRFHATAGVPGSFLGSQAYPPKSLATVLFISFTRGIPEPPSTARSSLWPPWSVGVPVTPSLFPSPFRPLLCLGTLTYRRASPRPSGPNTNPTTSPKDVTDPCLKCSSPHTLKFYKYTSIRAFGLDN